MLSRPKSVRNHGTPAPRNVSSGSVGLGQPQALPGRRATGRAAGPTRRSSRRTVGRPHSTAAGGRDQHRRARSSDRDSLPGAAVVWPRPGVAASTGQRRPVGARRGARPPRRRSRSTRRSSRALRPARGSSGRRRSATRRRRGAPAELRDLERRQVAAQVDGDRRSGPVRWRSRRMRISSRHAVRHVPTEPVDADGRVGRSGRRSRAGDADEPAAPGPSCRTRRRCSARRPPKRQPRLGQHPARRRRRARACRWRGSGRRAAQRARRGQHGGRPGRAAAAAAATRGVQCRQWQLLASATRRTGSGAPLDKVTRLGAECRNIPAT